MICKYWFNAGEATTVANIDQYLQILIPILIVPDKEHPGSRHALFHHLAQWHNLNGFEWIWMNFKWILMDFKWIWMYFRPTQMFKGDISLNLVHFIQTQFFLVDLDVLSESMSQSPSWYNTWTPFTILVRSLSIFFLFAECRNSVHSSGLWRILFDLADFYIFFLYFVFSPQTSLRNGHSHSGKWSYSMFIVRYAKYMPITDIPLI